MPISIVDMASDEATTSITYRTMTAEHVVYRPNAVTPELTGRVRKLSADVGDEEALATVLSEVLVSWDVLGADGQEIEPTVANLHMLPIAFLYTVLQGIQEDMRPLDQKGVTSVGGSSTHRKGARR